MTEHDGLGARLDALEMRIAYQDETIQELNDSVTAQWRQIDTLTRLVARLTDQLEETRNSAAFSAQVEPPPPHY